MTMSTVVDVQKKESIMLPPPRNEQGATLMRAMKLRRSSREFTPKPLPHEILSTLLWAAFGCGFNGSSQHIG